VAKPDGLTRASINPAYYFNQIRGSKEIKFDWTKFTWLASFDPVGRRVVTVMLGSGELGRAIVTHPAMPVDRTKIMRDAFMKSMADLALLAEASKLNLEITAVSGEELTKIAKEVIDQPPEVLDRIRKILAE
jgi:hypothetical protein